VLVPGFTLSLDVGRLLGFGGDLVEGVLDLAQLVPWREVV
jgi:hypothetical protein